MNTFPHYLNQNKQIFYRNASNQKLLKVEKSSPIKTTHQLQFELLNIFYIVTICGSICLASERLGMTQPAISLSLNKLEKGFGLKLFTSSKTTKYFKLTSEGLLLFNCIQRLFRILDDGISLSELPQILIQKKYYQNQASFLKEREDKKLLIHNRKFFYPLPGPPVKLFRNLLNKEFEFKNLDVYFFDFRSKIFLFKKKNFYVKSKNKFPYDFIASSSNKFVVNSSSEFKKLHTHTSLNLQEKHCIEIQTLNAIKTCLELDIYELTYTFL